MTDWLVTHAVLAFFSLIMGILSFWVKRSPWIWGSFFLLSYILAFFAKIVTPLSLAPILALFFLHALIKEDLKGFVRFVLVFITLLVSIGLWGHYLPGFHNWQLLKSFPFSANSLPINFTLNYDKPFVGIFVLAWGLPLLTRIAEFERVIRLALPLIIGGIIILFFTAYVSNMIRWDPKLPNIFWIYAPANLFLTVIPEEAFLRGFLQNEFFLWFGRRGFAANIGAVFCTSLLFALLHLNWTSHLPFSGLIFLAGIIYGSIYQYTRSLEASIFCHWLFNIIHLLLFTSASLSAAL